MYKRQALILAALRNICGYNQKVTQEKEWEFSDAPKLYRINGSTLGLIGCGRIPRKVAVMAKGFGMKLVGYEMCIRDRVCTGYFGSRTIGHLSLFAATAMIIVMFLILTYLLKKCNQILKIPNLNRSAV